MNKREIGSQYEQMAVEYLQAKGCRILAKNYRNLYGEIDIIYEEKDHTICYTEIKYRSDSRFADPLEAVNRSKQRRISQVAAYHYAYSGGTAGHPCRFDVIGIYADGTIRHIKNAFDFQGRM